MFKAIALSCLVAASLMTAAGAPAARADEQTAALPPTHLDRIVVLKSQRQMVLMRGDHVVKVYRVALGRYPAGHKTEAGDSRTPEGTYQINRRLSDSNFYRAIQISYPNDRDVAQARARGVNPGGQIMIHGLPNEWTADQVGHPRLDWTQGCIAVTNREMDEIWRMVQLGTTVEIYP